MNEEDVPIFFGFNPSTITHAQATSDVYETLIATLKSDIIDLTPQPAPPVMTDYGIVSHTESAEEPALPSPTIPAQSGSTLAPVKDAIDDKAKAQKLELEKLRKQSEPATLKQHENMFIRGKSIRNMVMQSQLTARGKLESTVLLLKIIEDAEDVGEDLEAEIEEEFSKYGKV